VSVPPRPGPVEGSPPGPAGGGPSAQPLRPRRARVLALTAVAVFATDLLTKALVVAELMDRQPVRLLGGALYLTHARNAGAAFAFAQGATVVFTAVAAVVVLVIMRTASRLRSVPWAICLGLILGGAAGNLVDRIFRAPGPLRGHVVDWISVFDPYGKVWPIFNVADSGIVVGGVMAVLLAFLGIEMDGTRTRRRSPVPEPDAPAAPPPRPPGRDESPSGPHPGSAGSPGLPGSAGPGGGS
jgi:signal peptidase II